MVEKMYSRLKFVEECLKKRANTLVRIPRGNHSAYERREKIGDQAD
jgi:GTP cyclohydrolase FolE2